MSDQVSASSFDSVVRQAISTANALTPEAAARVTAYYRFLADKADITVQAGFDVDSAELHPSLRPDQKDAIIWAARRGQALIAEQFGMGKTRISAELMRLVYERTGQQTLIIAPLGVRHQFVNIDGPALGIRFQYVRDDAEAATADTPYLITNYERVRDGSLTESYIREHVAGVTLDEAAILGNLGTLTQQNFTRIFADLQYRWCATATPAPNDYRQMIYFADFLGVMDAGQALTRFFGRNPDKAGDLYLLPHMEREYWLWVASWALFVERPSDLGYDDAGFVMPELDVRWHRLAADHRKAWDIVDNNGQHYLMKDTAAGVKQAIREKRDSMAIRVDEALSVVSGYLDGDTEQVIIWCGLNDEQRMLERGLKERGISYSSIYGSLDVDEVEARLFEWLARRTQVLISKAVMLGNGVNLQQCHVAVYAGIDFKFRDFIQSVHRIQRYGQQRPVTIHLIHTDAEDHVVDVLQKKWEQHRELVDRMKAIIQEYGLTAEALVSGMQRSIGVTRQETRGHYFTAVNNDTVIEMERFADNSVDCIVTSIPFGNHYEYVASLNDFGHNPQDADFWNQMDYLVPHLFRALKPGRVAAIHVKDRILYGHQNEWHTTALYPFSDDCNRSFMRHGFIPVGRITVTTDVVRENNSTNRLGWTENSKDSTKMGVGLPEYVLLFRKPQTDTSRSYADEPVTKDKAVYSRARWQIDAHAYWKSDGNRHLTPAELAEIREMLPGMDTGNIYRWWQAWDKTHLYDNEAHVSFGEALEAAGRDRLPAKFMLMPPQAPEAYEDYVWTDILFMRTLNMDQARRRVEKHVCLARGSLVLTKCGYKPIETVIVGEMVLTHMGRWRPVLAVQNTGVRPVVELHAQGVPSLTLTPDHKLWVRKSDWQRARDGAVQVNPGWLRADETEGGYVNLKLPPVEDSPLTEQECWLIGRWLADGHIGVRGEIVVSVGPAKLAEFEQMAGKHVGTRAEHDAVQIRLKALSETVKAAILRCGRGASGKGIPGDLLALPEPKARALLEGYLSGDGHFVPGRERWMATSISKPLVLGLAVLAQRVYGVVASIHAGKLAGVTVIEGRTVHTQQEWVISFDAPGKPRRAKPFILDDGAWKKVRKVAPAGEVETWNLRVEEDESYTAEGCIVKNCPLPLDIVDRLITRFSNPDEIVLDPFGGLFTVPVRAVALGRYGYGCELNPLYWENGVKYLRDAEAQRDTPTLFDFLLLDAPEAALAELDH